MAAVSFEVFPPRTAEGHAQLRSAIDRLAKLRPSFISVTCGAGGSDAGEGTLETARAIAARARLRIAGHLTCAGRTRGEVDAAARGYWAAGVRHIVALRGDMPDPGLPFQAHPGGYGGSLELVAGLRRVAPFELSVAAYPEPHPQSRSARADLELLARKADAGAARAITQFCFHTEAIVRLRDAVARAGIALPIIPGIMLVTNFAATRRMAQRCGASIPERLAARFAGADDEPDTCRLLGAIVAARQVEQLCGQGFEEFHFYTLNRADVVGAVCRQLELAPAQREELAA
jgi:methylenetetrahydrofolate reductase (NADPH)